MMFQFDVFFSSFCPRPWPVDHCSACCCRASNKVFEQLGYRQDYHCCAYPRVTHSHTEAPALIRNTGHILGWYGLENISAKQKIVQETKESDSDSDRNDLNTQPAPERRLSSWIKATRNDWYIYNIIYYI